MNFATIGTSAIAHTLVQTILLCEGMEYVATYSRSQEKASAFAHKYRSKRVYTDLHEMLLNSTIELVYVASPNALHFEQVKQILKAGKHVICEKPITLREDELCELIDLAKKQHCFLFEAISTLHMPNYHVLKEAITKIGTMHLVVCDLSQYSMRYASWKQGESMNVFDPSMGGGALYDLGVYCLHFVIGLWGMPTAYSYAPLIRLGVDTSGSIQLMYPHMNVILTYGKDSHGSSGVKIQSEMGYLEVEGPCSRIPKILWHDKEGIKDISQNTVEKHHLYEIQAFLNIISENDVHQQDLLWKQSLRVCQIIDAMHKERVGIL